MLIDSNDLPVELHSREVMGKQLVEIAVICEDLLRDRLDAWRQRGGWDATLDNACFHNPAFVPGECSFDAQGQVLFGAHP
jgi:hypothetical protein